MGFVYSLMHTTVDMLEARHMNDFIVCINRSNVSSYSILNSIELQYLYHFEAFDHSAVYVAIPISLNQLEILDVAASTILIISL